MSDPVRALLAKAERSLKSACRSFDDSDYDFAVSRAYYAMFYAAEALLLSRGLTFARHTGVIAAFNQHFVRTGELDYAHYAALQSAFDERNTADYGYEEAFPVETARTVIDRASAFLRAAGAKLTG